MEKYLNYEEKVVLRLRGIYEQYGYRPYKMSKFEEYDLYAENKRFLVSKNVITFTDNHGKLMALKPDVTLSIIKNYNSISGQMEKVYYDEHVYRASGYDDEFCEITQTGLECIGKVDMYTTCEILRLAMMSLNAIADDFVLDVSHMGIIEGLLCDTSLNNMQRDALLKAMSKKSIGEITSLCESFGLCPQLTASLCSLCSVYGHMGTELSKIKELWLSEKAKSALAELTQLWELLKSEPLAKNLNIDISMANEPEYYSGVVFKGYVSGVPAAVLSGGRYDRLMEKLSKNAEAIGFAVYMNLLEQLLYSKRSFDVDVLLSYESCDDVVNVMTAAQELINSGYTVRVQEKADEKIRFKRLMKLNGKEAYTVYEND